MGLGAIKRARRDYAADKATRSGVPFEADMKEFGYVAVSGQHKGHGLSAQIANTLLAQNGEDLFATTDEDRMKRTLRKSGFERRGQQWKGKRGYLSLWVRDTRRTAFAAAHTLTGWVDYDRDKLPGLSPAERVIYFEWRVRRMVINPLERILTSEISPTEQSSALLIFGVSLCCAIEAAGHFLTGGSLGNRARFDAFLHTYMDKAYRTEKLGKITYGDVLREHFRNGLAHGFSVCHGGFEGVAGGPYLTVNRICGVDTLEINPSSFFDDYAVGVERYLADLRAARPAEAIALAFQKVFESVFVKGQ